jgi:uncharacterized protein YodC (DUF2158 family)
MKIGDVVTLKSGSPKMTVTNVGERKGVPHVWVSWLKKDGTEETGFYPAAALAGAVDKPVIVNRGPPGGTWAHSRRG